MNLLTDDWLPVRPLEGGTFQWIGLSALLTENRKYEICLPRDDLELAALQLVICITQVLFTPQNMKELVSNLKLPMPEEAYSNASETFKNWFEISHPKSPFMQVRGVKAKITTPTDKLMPGLTGATNCCFINEPGQADCLCGGCTAIALFNQASDAPGFGGGFKAGLRGSAPITTLVQGMHLRETIWLNVLTSSSLVELFPANNAKIENKPTWVEPIKEKSIVPAASISLMRGLFWQPAHIELCPAQKNGCCTCCSRTNTPVYSSFLKAKFNYTVDGLWPHPHSPRLLALKKAAIEEKFAAFTTNAPTWTRLASFVVQQQVNKKQKNGHQPASVVIQARKLFSRRQERLMLAAGGYRNKQASILERRHDILSINEGWHKQPLLIREFIDLGMGYKTALRKALFVFSKGIKEIKGAGVSVQELGEFQFYRRTDEVMQKAVAQAHFGDIEKFTDDKINLRTVLKTHCIEIFNEQTRPYLNDPELIRTMAVAKRMLYKSLRMMEPETKGGE